MDGSKLIFCFRYSMWLQWLVSSEILATNARLRVPVNSTVKYVRIQLNLWSEIYQYGGFASRCRFFNYEPDNKVHFCNAVYGIFLLYLLKSYLLIVYKWARDFEPHMFFKCKNNKLSFHITKMFIFKEGN